jgi:serine/threonine-protein kinase PknK
MSRRTSETNGQFEGFDDVHLIGGGSFADVYRARDTRTNQAVALKVLQATVRELGRDNTFDLEVRALGTLSAHPNIVTLHRAEVLPDGRPMLVLELCEISLADKLAASGPLHPAEAVRTAVQICGALETAHRSGILHRDIKPQNILLSRYGAAQLADFGVAEMKSASGHEYAVSGMTVLHAPPEILWGHEATPSTDVYALASTVYELLSGHSPFFLTHDETPAAVRLRILNQAAPPLSIGDMPPRLWDVLERALSKNPADRHETALDFALDLRAVEQSVGWPVTECLVEGQAEIEPPDTSRLRPRMTGAVITSGSVPSLGGFGKGFGTSGTAPAAISEDIAPLEPIAGRILGGATHDHDGSPLANPERIPDPLAPAAASPTVVTPPATDAPVVEEPVHHIPTVPEPVTAEIVDPVSTTAVAPVEHMPERESLLALFRSTGAEEPSAPVIEEEPVEPVPAAATLKATGAFPVEPSTPVPPDSPVDTIPVPIVGKPRFGAGSAFSGLDVAAPAEPPSPLVPDPTPSGASLPDTHRRKTDAEVPPTEIPDNPSAVPGEVLWGFTPRKGLTGTIQLNSGDRAGGIKSGDDDKDRGKKKKFGRKKDRD